MQTRIACLLLLATLSICLTLRLHPQSDQPTTLHAYTNLIELPVLVLSHSRDPLPTIEASKFGISLDNGPFFHPPYVRREGEDPLSLAILVDLAGNSPAMRSRIPDALPALGTGSLHPQDHLVIYALGCKLTRTQVVPPLDATHIRIALEGSLTSSAFYDKTNPRAKNDRTPCRPSVQLWDAMAYIVGDLQNSGRQVLLALTDGNDRGSRTSWSQLRKLAGAKSVTIVGLTEPSVHLPGEIRGENYLTLVSELSGGIVLRSSPSELPEQLRRFVSMLRDRYIVYFSRANSLPAGSMSVDVTVGKRGAYIRSTGVRVPLADPKLIADPSTIPSTGTATPPIGTRRALTPQP